MSTYINKVSARMEFNQFKSLIYLILFTALMLIHNFSNAQNVKGNVQGLTASFGTRSASLASNIREIDELMVLAEGGSAGIVVGNDILLTRIQGGLYYSAARVPRTINLIVIEGLVNYYVAKQLGLSNAKFQPYFTGGVTHDFYKFYGRYLQNEGKAQNNSVSTEPHLGTVQQTRLTGGLGIEREFEMESSFVKIFFETRLSAPLTTHSASNFRNTQIKNGTAFNLGVSFGMYK